MNRIENAQNINNTKGIKKRENWTKKEEGEIAGQSALLLNSLLILI